MDFKIVIPARFDSTRLPGKPLLPILGRPMIQHVHERALESGANQVVVATDDQRVADAARAFSAEVCITRSDHTSGTERIAEVCRQHGWSEETIVVNLQGDEPGMPPELLDQVAENLHAHGDASVATLATPIKLRAELFDPHIVKVVTDGQGYALYFSRAPIPWHRDEFLSEQRVLPPKPAFLRHIGIYAYRSGFLSRYVEWQGSPIEEAESLEQLRVLWHGARIHVCEAVTAPGHGVDTQDDLIAVKRRMGESING